MSYILFILQLWPKAKVCQGRTFGYDRRCKIAPNTVDNLYYVIPSIFTGSGIEDINGVFEESNTYQPSVPSSEAEIIVSNWNT